MVMSSAQARVETSTDRNCPLRAAIRGGHTEAVSRLMAGTFRKPFSERVATGGADPNRNQRGPTALRSAVLHGHTEAGLLDYYR